MLEESMIWVFERVGWFILRGRTTTVLDAVLALNRPYEVMSDEK